ncbi:MAG: hypothetical protein R3B70_47860 [Polyangiaceae bacterium]
MLRDIPIDSVEPASFAPSVESVTIRFNPAYHGPTRKVVLVVTNRNGERVFRTTLHHKRNLTRNQYTWGGERTKHRGFIDPAGSPYTISAQAEVPAPTGGVYNAYLHVRESSRNTVSSLRSWLPSLVGDRLLSPLTRQVEVHYHSIEISWGDYLPPEGFANLDAFVQSKAPGYAGRAFLTDAKTILWVWYKLSQLGYSAGPRTSAVHPALGWAILRYKQAHADLYQKIYRQAGADYAIDDALRDTAKSITPELITALSANQNNRFDRAGGAPENIVEELEVLKPHQPPTRVFIDVERFYVGTGVEFNGRRKSAVDSEWCARPHLPIRAKVFLRDSRGGKVQNVNDRSALGDFRVKWTWEEDRPHFYDSDLPRRTPGRPSRTKDYLDRAREAVGAAIPSPHGGNRRRNARTAVGGLLSGDDAADAVSPFRACEPYPFIARDDGVETGPSNDTHASTLGATTVHFAPSIIAGDTYVLKATLVTANLAPQPHPAALTEETGPFEVWRRARVDAALRWTTAAFADWDGVREHFEAAKMEISGPRRASGLRPARRIARGDQQAVDAFFTREHVWSKDAARDAHLLRRACLSAGFSSPRSSRSWRPTERPSSEPGQHHQRGDDLIPCRTTSRSGERTITRKPVKPPPQAVGRPPALDRPRRMASGRRGPFPRRDRRDLRHWHQHVPRSPGRRALHRAPRPQRCRRDPRDARRDPSWPVHRSHRGGAGQFQGREPDGDREHPPAPQLPDPDRARRADHQ